MNIECHKHWSIFITRGIWALLILIFGIRGWIVVKKFSDFLLCAIIAVIIMLPAIICYKTDYLAIDGNMLVGRKGFIKSVRLSTPLSKVQGISIGNGLLGKIFGFHTITISSAGTAGTEYIFKQMSDAESFVAAVNSKIA